MEIAVKVTPTDLCKGCQFYKPPNVIIFRKEVGNVIKVSPTCDICHEEIESGSTYFKFDSEKIYCEDCVMSYVNLMP
jgi:hypothetical protein